MSRQPESRREKQFRLSIVKNLPRFPNTRETLTGLEAMTLDSVLIHYANWALRYVPPRIRRVHVEPEASGDHRWLALQPEIAAFLDKVARGEDITSHLSLDPHTRGYTPSNTSADRWADKDFVLNVMGYHHFHLGTDLESKGHTRRTDELIFARVTRDTFTVVAIFDHSVFEMQPAPSEGMNSERNRLRQVFDAHVADGLPPGSVYLPTTIATSGHPLFLVRLATQYVRIVRDIDPKLDGADYVRDLYCRAGIPIPKNPKLKWHLNFLDFGLLDNRGSPFLILRKGPS